MGIDKVGVTDVSGLAGDRRHRVRRAGSPCGRPVQASNDPRKAPLG